MKVLSLFSGIGGFDLGFERAGMQIVGMCEIDKHARSVLSKHFPDAAIHTDIREVSYERGAVDVICGGFPCQDISVAGKRAGLDGERSGLWFEYARIIDETQPKWAVIENVPGLFSSAGGRDFTAIIRWLANRGYGVGWRVLDSQGFGLAQRRKRVFIIASFGSPSACSLLLEQESMLRDSEQSRKARKKDTGTVVKCLTAHGTRLDGDTETFVPVYGSMTDNIARTITTQERVADIVRNIIALPIGEDFTQIQAAVAWKMRLTGGNASGVRGGANKYPGGQGYLESDRAFTIGTSQDQFVTEVKWESLSNVSPTLRAESKQSLMTGTGVINAPIVWNSNHTDDVVRINANQEAVPTLTARMGTGGNNVPMIGARRLTPVECERLQGFPDNWTGGQADTHRFKQLGNAVSVPVAEWIGRRIMAVEGEDDE